MNGFRSIIRLSLAGILVACSIAASIQVAGAAAAPQPKIKLQPSDAHGQPLPGVGYFHFRAPHGSTTHLFALIGNDGQAKATVSLVPVDAQSGVYGGISYNLPKHARHHVGSWIKLPTKKVALQPGQSKVIPFTVHLPKKLKPGQYIGGLTEFVPAPHAAKSKFGSLTLQLRTVAAVLITSPGPSHRAFRILGLSAKYQPSGVFAILHLQNSGNLLLAGSGRLTITKAGSAKPAIATRLIVNTTVPHSTINYPTAWTPKPAYGVYLGHVVIRWHGGKTTWNKTFRVGPAPALPHQNGRPVSTLGPVKSSGSSLGAVLGSIGLIGLVLVVGVFAVVFLARRPRLDLTPTRP